jgi:tetraacyldisaccharide 4'-kinase
MTGARSTLAAIQSGRLRTFPALLLRFALIRVSAVYWCMVALRHLFYRLPLAKTRDCPGKVISIGNLTTGGTGKTPVTAMIGNWLDSRGAHYAILSRGYRSASEHEGAIADSATVQAQPVAVFGDEVSLLADKLRKTWFGVGKNRRKNAEILYSQHGAGVFLLDDGFQHLALHRDCDIVLIDAVHPFGNGHLLPAGSLREPQSSLSRADLVIITRTESVSSAELIKLNETLSRYLGQDQIFEVRTVINRFYDFATRETVTLQAGRTFLGFCAIGNPDGFVQLLKSCKVDLEDCISFDDHHQYTERDVIGLRERLSKGNHRMLVTTEKDAVKLPRDSFEPERCAVVEISIAFAARGDIFWGKLAEVLAC